MCCPVFVLVGLTSVGFARLLPRGGPPQYQQTLVQHFFRSLLAPLFGQSIQPLANGAIIRNKRPSEQAELALASDARPCRRRYDPQRSARRLAGLDGRARASAGHGDEADCGVSSMTQP
jgi:hypothetical protein